MNTRFEQPSVLPPEEKTKEEKEQAKIEQKRNLSDIRLRFGGAEQKDDGRLEVTAEQVEKAKEEMEKEMKPILEKRGKEQEREQQRKSLAEIRFRFEREGERREWRPEEAFGKQDKERQKASLAEIRSRFGRKSEWRSEETTQQQKKNKEICPPSDPAEIRAEREKKRQEGVEQKRNLSDIRLRLEGAEYKLDDEGGRRLEVTPKQIEEAGKEMDRDLEARQFVKEHDNWFVRKAYQMGGAACIGWLKAIGKVFGFFKNILKEAFRALLGLGVAVGGASLAGIVGIGLLKRRKGGGR